jgi:hypothetical protein
MKNYLNKKYSLIIIASIFAIVFTFLPLFEVKAVISRVQSKTAGRNGSTISATWTSATTTGNLLVAIISFRGGSGVTVTPPAGIGWVAAVRANNSTTVSTAIYYKVNANSQSGASTWGLSSSQRATLTLIEYAGAATSAVLDMSATTTGTGVTGNSGTTPTTTQADEVAVAGISANNAGRTFSAQSNAFTEVSEINSGGGATGVATVFEEKIISATGTQNVSATISSSSAWAGVIATFKAFFVVNNPVPTTTSISPTSKTVGSATFTLTVDGTNFIPTSVVNFAGSPRTTTYVSATQLTASIPASDLISVGTFNITVFNPTPGGGTSNAQTFTVGNLVPTTTSINPNSKTVGDVGFTITVNGTNFIPSSVVKFNGLTRTTTYISSTRVTSSILTSDLASAGSFLVVVNNPSPGGGDSNAQIFKVQNTIPSTTSISPASVPVGSAQITMTVYGTNFVSNSQVKFGGSAKSTIFISSTQLTAIILASDLISAGTFSVTVYNPTTGETSNAQYFTVGNLSRREFNYSRTFYGSGSLRR